MTTLPLLLPAICGQLPTPTPLGLEGTAPPCPGWQKSRQRGRWAARGGDCAPTSQAGRPQLWLSYTCQAERLGPPSRTKEARRAQQQTPGRLRRNLPSPSGGPPIFCLLTAPINLYFPLPKGEVSLSGAELDAHS